MVHGLALHGGVLANVVEYQLAVTNRPRSVLHREWLHALDNPPVHEHFALPGYLKKEDFALVGASIGVGKLLDEEDAAILVKLDFPIDEIGNRDLHRITAGLLH